MAHFKSEARTTRIHLACTHLAPEPGRSAHHGPRHTSNYTRCAQLSDSLNFFSGSTLTVCDFGFALKTHGSLVKGFTPLRAGTAGLILSFMLSTPANLKEPVFFSSFAAMPTTAPNTAFTSLGLRPAVSAAAAATAPCVIAAVFIAAPFIGAARIAAAFTIAVKGRGINARGSLVLKNNGL